MSDSNIFNTGVVTGRDVQRMFAYAKFKQFALPAVNVTSTCTINAVLEASQKNCAPMIIQFSHGGASFFAGKGLRNDEQEASIAGAISGAHHVHQMAALYKVPVLVHTDHASLNLLPWIDGLLDEGERFFAQHGKPLFSSHMIDLSGEALDTNIAICKRYLTRMAKMGMTLEIELGVTGGEEDGVDNSHIDSAHLYTQPEDVAYAFRELSDVSDQFTIAASFGNVHGVYRPGNVHLRPEILRHSQEYLQHHLDLPLNSVDFVFHGGSGSSLQDIHRAIDYGVVKMNVDTDLQWAFWDGVKSYYEEHEAYLQSQIGNPENRDKPNKQYYDPRVWLRRAEASFEDKLMSICKELRAIGQLDFNEDQHYLTSA